MKRFLKFIGYLIFILVSVVIVFFVFITWKDYQPLQVEILQSRQVKQEVLVSSSDTFSVIDWNIGYAGLGEKMDFFYDGGSRVRDSREATEDNLANIFTFMKSMDSVDFWMIQEVDRKAKRSYGINQEEALITALSDFFAVYAINYQVPFVPVPVTEPMGQVQAGMMTLSKFRITESVRYAYPLIASWPDRLFLLDRCFILTRYALDNGHELILINTHNSAYVYDSILRKEELEILKDVMMEEYMQGNYVVAGGDWNQNPPDYEVMGDYNGHHFVRSKVQMAAGFMPPDWQWIFDGQAPTNRDNNQRYIKGINGTSALDYFVVSPNVVPEEVCVIDLNFVSSDHNPIFFKFSLSNSAF